MRSSTSEVESPTHKWSNIKELQVKSNAGLKFAMGSPKKIILKVDVLAGYQIPT